MKIKPTIVAVLAVASVGGATLLGGSLVHAQSIESGNTIVDKIATKFNLNRDEVKAVFDEAHSERKVEMKSRISDHLQSKVDDGTLTVDQKNALEAKLEELETKREALKDQGFSHREMHEQMKADRDDLESWAKEQGIDIQALLPMGHKGRGGHGFGLRHSMDESSSSSTDDTADTFSN